MQKEQKNYKNSKENKAKLYNRILILTKWSNRKKKKYKMKACFVWYVGIQVIKDKIVKN